jgi:hypothetical protein
LGVSGKGFDLVVFLDGSVIASESLLARGFRLGVKSVDFLLGFDEFEFTVELGSQKMGSVSLRVFAARTDGDKVFRVIL